MRDGGERGDDEERTSDSLLREEEVHHGDRLRCLAQTHLVCQDGVAMVAPAED